MVIGLQLRYAATSAAGTWDLSRLAVKPMESQNKTGRRGCLYYGAVVFVVFSILLGLGLAFGINMARRVRTEFTDAAPQTLPSSPISATEYRSLEQRIQTFTAAVQHGQAPPPLELSAEELNALIERAENLKAFKGKIRFLLEDERLRGQLSAPMGEVGLPVFRDRYLNATVDFHWAVGSGSLKMAATNIVVHGKPLPNIYLNQIRKQNLAAQVNDLPGMSEGLNLIESVQVTNGRLRIAPKIQ